MAMKAPRDESLKNSGVYANGNQNRRQTIARPADPSTDITRKTFDRYYCRILFCPCCLEIFHDRNMPVDLPFCKDLLCQLCIKKQLLSQVQGREQKDGVKVKLSCAMCQKSQEYQSAKELDESIQYNYEVLGQVYRVRAKIAEKAAQIYEMPDLKEPLQILAVKKIPRSEEMRQKQLQEQQDIQLLNQALQQCHRQQNLMNSLREEVVCFICVKAFNEKDRLPLTLEGCQHKICKPCHLKEGETQEVICRFCNELRPVKSINDIMQKWLIKQGVKKKIVLRKEIEDIQRTEESNVLQLRQVLSGSKEEEKKEEIKSGSGALQQKGRAETKGNDWEALIQKRQKMRIKTMKMQIKSSSQREIQCSLCSGIYNKLNRPLLMQTCPCKVMHQVCEHCFKEQCLIQSKENQNKFQLSCPDTNKKKTLDLKYLKTKETVIDYYLTVDCPLQVIVVNENLLEYIYKNHEIAALAAERDIFQDEGEESEGVDIGNEHDSENHFDNAWRRFGSDAQMLQGWGQKMKPGKQLHSDLEMIKPEFMDNSGDAIAVMKSRSSIIRKEELFEQQKHCSQCRYDFSDGLRPPCLLKCGHNMCKDCMEKAYNRTKATAPDIRVQCSYDIVPTTYVKPSHYYEGSSIKETFDNFWKLSICVNTALMQLLIKEKSELGGEYFAISGKESYHADQESIDNSSEESKGAGPQTLEELPTAVKKGEEILYDIECPICLLCYSHDNPPINLHCSQHPNHPFVLCKNELMYYYYKNDSAKDMVIGCPVCHNEISFKTAGKSVTEVVKLFDVNQVLLNNIYGNKEFLDYIEKEEHEFYGKLGDLQSINNHGQGTTSSRVLLIDKQLKVVDTEQREHKQISLHPGWCEHDPNEILEQVKSCMEAICSRNNLSPANIKAIGITNQRETTVAFDKVSGEPLHNAIVWLDKRTSSVVQKMIDKNSGNKDCYREICGLPLNTYFSAVKMRWLLDHVEKVREAQTAGNLVLGTIDTWLIYKLSGHKNIYTDSSNASRTMLMDLNTLEWSQQMLDAFDIDIKCLPEIKKSSSDLFGHIETTEALKGVPITGVLGDQQAACLGHLLKEGEVKNTYGTGCFILKNIGTTPKQSTHGMLSTICYRLGDNTYYALEGAVEIAGAALQWARSVGFIDNFKDLENIAKTVSDNGDVYFVPAFNGIFSPYWRDDARGLIIGIGVNTEKGHLVRALLEAPCFRTKEVIDAMVKDSNCEVTKINVDGGMTVNDLVLQTQADLTGATIVRKQEKEITSIGAAIAAGLQVGVWSSVKEVEETIQIDKIFESQMDGQVRENKLKRWQEAVKRSIGFGWQNYESE